MAGVVGMGTVHLEITIPRERDRQLVVAGLLALIVPICAQPFLGGPRERGSITRLREAKAHGEGDNGNQALFRVYDRMTNQAAT